MPRFGFLPGLSIPRAAAAAAVVALLLLCLPAHGETAGRKKSPVDLSSAIVQVASRTSRQSSTWT